MPVVEQASGMIFLCQFSGYCEPVEQVPPCWAGSENEIKPIDTPTSHAMGAGATHAAQHPRTARMGHVWHQEWASAGLGVGAFVAVLPPKIAARHPHTVA